MEIDPATLVNAGGLALFALAVLFEIRKLGPIMAKMVETVTRLEERSRITEELVGELADRVARRRLYTPHGGVAPIGSGRPGSEGG